MKIGKLGFIILVVPILAVVIAYPFLPATIPYHWNNEWVVDRSGSKNFLFLLTPLPFFIYLRIKSRYFS